MKFTLGIGVASVLGFGQFLTNNIYFIAELSMLLALYKWAWLPLKEFESEPTA